jgi:unsaturated chondroitin disaccharide hydrolase
MHQSLETALDWGIEAQANADRKILALLNKFGPAFFHATANGSYVPGDADWWTSGFWPGMLLLSYRRTKATQLLDAARTAEAELEQTMVDDRFYGLHHDVGFQFHPTAVMHYKLTNDPASRRRGLLAANFLMSRFNPAGSFIEAWNTDDRRGMVIIDTMMNLPLLYWAAAEFNQPRYRNVADAHAQTAMRTHIRKNGETHHIVRFDQVSGAVIEPMGGQGFGPYSCWSRGQSWALYGFALAYRHTGNPDYLATSRRVADNFIAALPPEMVPPWDFHAPNAAAAPRDSSAGAIAASGLLELAHLLPDGEGEAYCQAALTLMQGLIEHCGTADRPDQDGLLMHATGNLPRNQNIDVSLIYGDFYFLEALDKINGITETCW